MSELDRISKLSLKDILNELMKLASNHLEEYIGDSDRDDYIKAYKNRLSELNIVFIEGKDITIYHIDDF